MQIKGRTLLAALLVATTALGAQAQVAKAGLWEVTSKLGGSPEIDKAMAQMQQQMASMPPEQRKQMEAMMAKQGLGMSGGPGGIVTKMCMSKEMVERSQLPMQTQGDCTSTTSDKTSTGMKLKFSCTNPVSSGEGQYTFVGDSAYTVKMKINSRQQGKPTITTIDATAKWLGSGCGNIKPMPIPK